MPELPNTASEEGANAGRRACEPPRRNGSPGRDRGRNVRRGTTTVCGPGNAGKEPRPDLAAAILAEREAHERLRAARAHLAALVIATVKSGSSYHELARLSVRTTKNRAATLDERRREADRLRQLAHRHPVTDGHAIRSRKFEEAPPSEARLDGEEITKMERLLKRTTIEETFSIDGTDEHRPADDLDDRDDVEVDDEDADEDDAATRKSRRR